MPVKKYYTDQTTEKVVSGGVSGGRAYPSYPADAPLSIPLKKPSTIVPPTTTTNNSTEENFSFCIDFSFCIEFSF